jgi:hypothetical protein
MWEPQRLTTLWTFTACYRDNFNWFTWSGCCNIPNMFYRRAGRQDLLSSTWTCNVIQGCPLLTHISDAEAEAAVWSNFVDTAVLHISPNNMRIIGITLNWVKPAQWIALIRAREVGCVIDMRQVYCSCHENSNEINEGTCNCQWRLKIAMPPTSQHSVRPCAGSLQFLSLHISLRIIVIRHGSALHPSNVRLPRGSPHNRSTYRLFLKLIIFLIRLVGGGVLLVPLGMAATDWPIVACPGWLWWWRIWWNEDWQGKPKSYFTRPGIEPGRPRWEASD